MDLSRSEPVPHRRRAAVHRLHVRLGFLLVALFIWFAENIGTYTGTWLYPRQMAHWTLVPLSKLTSWFLLMIISCMLVAWIQGVRALEPAVVPQDDGVALAR